MRWVAGYCIAAAVAAVVATVWIFVVGGGQTLFGTLHVPDLVGVYMPDVPILMRRLAAFYGTGDRAAAVLLDLPVAFVLFLILDLPGALLLGAFETTWGESRSWRDWRPLWAALLFGVMGTTFVLAGLSAGVPPFSGLQLSPIAIAIAALFAGSALGLRMSRSENDYAY